MVININRFRREGQFGEESFGTWFNRLHGRRNILIPIEKVAELKEGSDRLEGEFYEEFNEYWDMFLAWREVRSLQDASTRKETP